MTNKALASIQYRARELASAADAAFWTDRPELSPSVSDSHAFQMHCHFRLLAQLLGYSVSRPNAVSDALGNIAHANHCFEIADARHVARREAGE
ncbi:hypothetical protein [Paracoccus marcusii]|uniref:hypothetical protein n=1 Tax=Paracoccus marcusii TaxID=59779 RepID=UPI0024930875|nr:hypothetical protein [Paracoccus marcusii]